MMYYIAAMDTQQDNIVVTPDAAEIAKEEKLEEVQQTENNAGKQTVLNIWPNLQQVCDEIAKKFGKTMKINFRQPSHLIEGSVGLFIEQESGNIIASGRLRFSNDLVISNDHNMYVQMYLTDIVCNGDMINSGEKQ